MLFDWQAAEQFKIHMQVLSFSFTSATHWNEFTLAWSGIAHLNTYISNIQVFPCIQCRTKVMVSRRKGLEQHVQMSTEKGGECSDPVPNFTPAKDLSEFSWMSYCHKKSWLFPPHFSGLSTRRSAVLVQLYVRSQSSVKWCRLKTPLPNKLFLTQIMSVSSSAA